MGYASRMTHTALHPRHAAILRALVTGEHTSIEAGNSGLDGTAPHPTLRAMERRGLVTLTRHRQSALHCPAVAYHLARVTQAGIDTYNAEFPPSAEEALGECAVDPASD